jgi:signal transduction histidine kinase
MKFLRHLLRQLELVRQQIDPSSLRMRLTVGVATVSAIGLGGVVIWTSWNIQHLLVFTHKQNIYYIADRFPRDVELYSDMVSLPIAMQKAVDNLTTGDTWLWVIGIDDGKAIAQSEYLKMSQRGINSFLIKEISSVPQLQRINERYLLFYTSPLEVKKVEVGKLFIAEDITEDQIMFLSLVQSLRTFSILTLGGMTVTIAIYVKRSLQSLHKISQLTKNVSVESLKEVRIDLKNAPSEVKELAKTFDQMLVRLSNAWEHQRQLVSNVSHELRTPLTIVSGYLQSTLRRGNNLTEMQREGLEIANSEANRTIQLLQDLLDLARADSGRMYFNVELISLNDLIEEIGGMTKGAYSDRLINVQSYFKEIFIKADVNRLKQILLNLIDNAVKYSDAQQLITLKLDLQDNKAIIQVCDRGRGIPLPQQSRIFEPFYRLEEARDRTTGGTGLGLSIVKTLVEGMGGSISVRSQMGEGSTFIVEFSAVGTSL